MNKYEVLQTIFNEKIKIDNYKTKNELTQWFWKVGFRNIIIDEENKSILCEVSRPNQFISKFRKPIINFLIHLQEHVFIKKGYTFEIKKYSDDEYYNLFTKYIDEAELV